jgi:hypothetical protein
MGKLVGKSEHLCRLGVHSIDENGRSQCGERQVVDSFPDFIIQYVDAFPDFRVRFVDALPGKP